MDAACYSFQLEWLDPFADLRRPFRLRFHQRLDNKHKIELYDLKNRKMFLKPTEYPSISLDDLFIGARVTIFGRQMTVISYDDPATQKALAKHQQRCLAVVSAQALEAFSDAWSQILSSGLKLAHLRMVMLSNDDIYKLFESPPQFVFDGPIIVCELVGENAVQIWSDIAQQSQVMYASPSDEEVERILQTAFGVGHKGHAPDFPSSVTAFGATGPKTTGVSMKVVNTPSLDKPTAKLSQNSACAVILPHIIASKDGATLLVELLQGLSADGSPLQVTAMQLFELDLVTAEEFLEVYKFVVPEFVEMARELSSGLCLAIEITGQDAVTRLRRIAGPRDVDVAKRIRSNTLRAKYGKSIAQNAIHVTDLAEDGPTEAEYFFSVLQE